MTTPAPAWLTDVVGRSTEAARLPWGFHNESWLVQLPDGRRVAVTRCVDPYADPSRIAAVTARVAAAGLPVPTSIEWPSPLPPGVTVSAWIAGESGAAVLAHHGGPELVGRLCGSTWRRLAAVETVGLDLPAVRTDAGTSTRGIAGGLDRTERFAIKRALGALPGLLLGRARSFVHGDFVPVNILVRDERLAAVLDFEAACIDDPLFDAAWFKWVVGYHHAGDEPVAWAAFAAAAALDVLATETAELVRILPLVRILELGHNAPGGSRARTEWAAHLRAWIRRNGLG